MSACDWYLVAALSLYLLFYLARALQRRRILSRLLRGIFTNHIQHDQMKMANLTLTGGLFLNLLSLDEYNELNKQLPDDDKA